MNEDQAPLICFLTDNEISNSLCQDYWSLDPVSDWNYLYTHLLSRYALGRGEASFILKSGCRAYFPGLRCNGCGSMFEIKSRTDYSKLRKRFKRSRRAAVRHLCGICESVDSVRALEEERIDAMFKLQYLDLVIDSIRKFAVPIDYKRLSYVQSCFLYAALVAANVGPEEAKIPSLEFQSGELGSTKKLSIQIYRRLYEDGILIPLPSLNAKMIALTGEKSSNDLDVFSLDWTLADDTSGNTREQIFSMLFDRLDEPEPEAVEELWYLMGEHECEKYFMSLCARWRFIKADIYTPTIAATVRQYLEILSIGQMWNIIFYVLKDLAALAQANTYARQHVYNMIAGNIRRSADFRIANNRELTPWRRQQTSKEAWITSIVLDKVLKGGEHAFQNLTGRGVFKYVEDLKASRSPPLV